MREIVFSGGSDDIVMIDGLESPEEYNVYPSGPYAARFVLVDQTGATMAVHAIYDSTWCFAAGMGDEDVPFPDWPIRVEVESGYSTRLVISAPDDVVLHQTELP